MRSMTGYGRGFAEFKGDSASVELSAVNSRRQLEMRFILPRELSKLEPRLRRLLQERLSRGSLNVVVNYRLNPERSSLLANLNLAAAKEAAELLRQAARAGGLQHCEPSISDLLLMPGVLLNNESAPYEPLQELAEKALLEAITELDAMRLKEGEHLKTDLQERGKTLQQLLEQIAAQGEEAQQRQKLRLQERIAKLGVELSLDDERLAKEVVFYAERADISEEIVRLRSHLTQFFELLENTDEPGRNLDFLGQEMNREINTLSAKTADLSIANLALQMKSEMGRIREQIMNVE
ncbi:MAG: YicC family protein [Oligosphaeraceae bacterium]|jgi:uncharacterized protein (TIGR00255 family)|nr:YicC family protein [Oligosphaeraceae bacterium]